MATHDYVLANQSGSSFRTDLNNALAAVVSNNSNSSEPSTTYAYMLWVDTTNNLVKLRNSANNAWIILFTTNGGLDVDAASNFNADVTFTGANFNAVWDKSDSSLEFADNAKALFGSSGDLEIYHNGSGSYIENSGTGSLNLYGDDVGILNKARDEWKANFISNGGVELYYDNSKKLSTVSAGVVVDNGTMICNYGLEVSSYVNLTDNSKVQLGTSQDLQIYHNGSHSYIRNDTGLLHIDNYDGDIKIRPADGDTGIKVASNGGVELYYDNSKKLSTSSAGVVVDNGTMRCNDGFSSDTNLILNSDANANGASAIIFQDAGSEKARITGGNIRIANDSGKIQLGASQDLECYHSGSHSYVRNNTGILHIDNYDNDIKIRPADGDTGIKVDSNGGVELYFDNSKKLETLTGGVDITGDLTIDGAAGGTLTLGGSAAHTSKLVIADNGGTGNGHLLVEGGDGTDWFKITSAGSVRFEDNKKAILGADNDLEIYFDGTNCVLDSNTGELLIRNLSGSGAIYLDAKSGERGVKVIADGGVELYYDNSKQLSTESTGPHLHGLSAGSGYSDVRYQTDNGRLYYDSSTRLVKTDISDSHYGIDALKQLKPRKYKRIDIEGTPNEIGFIADEVVSVIPEIVPFGPKSFYTKNDSDTEEIPINVDYRRMTVVLTKALQEAITKIETLETKVAALEAA